MTESSINETELIHLTDEFVCRLSPNQKLSDQQPKPINIFLCVKSNGLITQTQSLFPFHNYFYILSAFKTLNPVNAVVRLLN